MSSNKLDIRVASYIEYKRNTSSEIIEFNDDFNKFFTYLAGDISAQVNNNENISNIEDYAIYIDPDEIGKVDEMDDDSPYNQYLKTGKFFIRNIRYTNEPDIPIYTKEPKEIFITEDATEIMKRNKGLIPLKELSDDINIFEITILNRELTKPLYDLMNLLDKNEDEFGVKGDIDSISQAYLDILIDAGIGANVISAELILNRLIRSVERPYERPDFSRRKLEPYGIYTVSKNLEKNRSPFIGLAYQNIKKQFLSDDLFEEKNGTSYLDPFFMTEVPMKNFKKYSEITFAEMKNNDIKRTIRDGSEEMIELIEVQDKKTKKK
jgi:hypothetical protein